jgi:hypothetical protein
MQPFGSHFLFSPHHFLGLLFDICHFFDKTKDDDLLKLWMPFFNPYFDHCLPAEGGSTESCLFPYIRGWTLKLRKEDDANQSSNLPKL